MQVEKLFNDAQALHKKGKVGPARKIYDRILKIDSGHAQTLIFVALIEAKNGDIESALTFAERAYSVSRSDPLILVNYGILLKNARKFDLAIQVYNEALQANPKLSSARANLATVYMLSGRAAEAEKEFKQVILETEEVAPYLNLARLALAKDDIEDAESYLEAAEARDPGHQDISVVRALISKKDRNDEVAYQSSVGALTKNPLSYEAWQTLRGVDPVVLNLRQVDNLFSMLLKTQSRHAGVFAAAVDLARKNTLWTYLPQLEERLTQGLEEQNEIRGSSSDAFTLLGANISQKAHRKLSEYVWKHSYQHFDRVDAPVWEKDSDTKLRVGFLSYDFRNHAIGYLIVGFMESLAGEAAQYYAYSNSDDDGSETRKRIVSSMHKFTNISKLTDSELSDVIQRDKIDILIDLSQVTSGTRASVFRYRPAAIQMQWLGMPGTLGAPGVCDYIIADRWVIDDQNLSGFSETPVLLDRSYQPNDHVKPDLTLSGTRADHNLPEDAVVFCSFNQHYKFSPDTIGLWCGIMNNVPNSILWLLKPKTEEHKTHLLSVLEQYDISSDRVIFAGHRPQKEHIARISHADLILDTWPYNAHTTCSDALRAGVPVVTLPGKVFASRVAQGILSTGNLSEWIASSSETYVKIAVDYASRPRAEINEIKEKIANTYWSSPMVDNTKFGKMFETMLVKIHAGQKQLCKASVLQVQADGSVFDNSGSDSTTQLFDIETVADLHNDGSSKLKSIVSRDKLKNLQHLKSVVIGLDNLPLVVDVGAADFDSAIGFEVLADINLARVVGFEPDHASFLKLVQSNKKNRRYINSAIGSGDIEKFNICKAPGMNSILQPDFDFLGYFPKFADWSEVIHSEEIKTVRLDDVVDLSEISFLKLDVQGAEFNILKNSLKCLQRATLLQLELSPTPLYQNEASFFEVGAWLQGQGWSLHALSNINKRALKPFGKDGSPYGGINHILQVDAVFIPDLRMWDKINDQRLLELSFWAHAIYKSFDLTERALWTLDQRDHGSRTVAYKEYLREAGLYA